MYTIKIEVKFRIGHRLSSPYSGKCNNIHGEAICASFEFEQANLNKNGMVEDFGLLKKEIKQVVDDKLDHSFLYKKGDYVGDWIKKEGFRTFEMEDNPTSENIAKMLYDYFIILFPNLKRVGIVESFEDSVAYYEGDEKC